MAVKWSDERWSPDIPVPHQLILPRVGAVSYSGGPRVYFPANANATVNQPATAKLITLNVRPDTFSSVWWWGSGICRGLIGVYAHFHSAHILTLLLLHPYWVVLLLAIYEDHVCALLVRNWEECQSYNVNMKYGWDGSSSATTEMSSEHSVSFRASLSVWGDHRFALKCSPVFLSAWHTPLFVCPFFREKNFNGFQVERKRQQSRWTRFLRWTGTYSRPMTGCCASNRWGESNHSDAMTVCLSVHLFHSLSNGDL